MQIEKAVSAVFTPLEDGTAVLLNLETLSYYSLNRTAAAIWGRIDEAKSIGFDDLVTGLCERFEVSENDARSHLGVFLERLQHFKMISIT